MAAGNKEILGFDDRVFRIVGTVLIVTFIPFLFFDHQWSDGWHILSQAWLVSFVMTLFYWEGSRQIIIYARKKWPDFQDTPRRILAEVGVVLIYSVIVENLVGKLFFSILNFDHEKPVSGFAGTYLLIFLVLTIYEAVYLHYQWRAAVIEQEKVRQEHIRSQLEGLRNQVNPHFLFNSLNTLMSIVAEDQNAAIRYLQKLSKVFRYVLENRDQQLIPLSQELEFIENYVFLQKERFQNNLRIKMQIPGSMHSRSIVPLSLQILFENAIKHNIISGKRPLVIEVFINDSGKLEVRNNLQRKNQVMNSTKVGLENVRNRYNFFTSERVEIKEEPDFFSVAIPLIRIQPETASPIFSK